MDQMIRRGLARSPTEAAKSIVEQQPVLGNSIDYSKIKRLVKRYRLHFG
jgi:hypothetical protein